MPEIDLKQVDALLMIYLNQGDATEALRLLEKFKIAFEEAGEVDSYVFWRVQALIANSQFSEAKEIAKAVSGPNRPILLAVVLEGIAKNLGEWQPLVDHLQEWYRSTGEGKVLLELCHELALRGEWEQLIAYSGDLMAKIGTLDALRLAVQAHYKTNKAQGCLDLLVKYSTICEDGILPSDLRRLKVACQTQLGYLSKAVVDAEELVRREPDTQNINLLMDAQLAEGDLKGLAITARLLISNPSTSIRDLLRAARLIFHEDIEAARQAWNKAVSQGVSDQDLGLALDLGFRLGLDNEIGLLTQRARQLATEGKGPFKPAEFPEIKKWMMNHAKNAALAGEIYEKGEVPIHLFAEKLNLTLSGLLHGISERNRKKPDPLVQPPIFCWHGGRQPQRQLLENYAAWNLCLDITSVTLAEELKILDLIEECFHAVRISRFLPTALVQQLDELETSQPALLARYRTLERLLREGKAHKAPVASAISSEVTQVVNAMGEHWSLTITAGLEDECFFVEFTPIVSHDGQFLPVDLPIGLREKFVNCKSVLDSLRANGHVSESMYGIAIQQLGSEGMKSATDRLPTIGANLYLMGNTVSLFASDEIIELVCQHFRVFIDSEFVGQAAVAMEAEINRMELRQWTTKLLNKVNAAVDRGHFVALRANEDQVFEATSNYSLRSLYDFFSFDPQAADVICIDDRFCNGYSNRDGAPIISILEVIQVLRTAGKLSNARYYESLLQLRASNLRYLSINKEELLYHLSQAQIIDGNIVETTELRILRKYVSSCLLDNHRLQKLPAQQGATNMHGEFGFIVNTMREITDSIVTCWENESFQVAEAKADWILNSLFTGLAGTRHLHVAVEPHSDGLDLLSLDIAGAYARGIALRKNNRKEYFNWLTIRLLRPRLHTDPSSITAIGDGIARLIASITEREDPSEQFSLIHKAMLSELYFDLPKPLQDELRANPELMGRLGIHTIDAIVLDDATFPAAKLWEAVNKALNNQPTELVGLSPKDTFVVKATDKDQEVAILDKKTGRKRILADPAFKVLCGNVTDWEEFLLSNRAWFDSDNETMKKKVMEIVPLTDLRSRFEEVSKIRNSSVAIYYDRLGRSILQTNQFAFDKLLPPSAMGLIRHFRISPEDESASFEAALEKSALQLIDEEGIETAILRLSSLPVTLPSSIQVHLSSIEVAERKTLILRLIPQLTSTVQRIHLIALMLASDAGEWSLDLAKETVHDLFNDEQAQDDFQLFHSILSWVNDEFSYWADAKTLSPQMRLAMVWAHSIHLHGMFQRAQADPTETANVFKYSSPAATAEIFDRDLTYWTDVLHPRRLNRAVLLTHGLAKTLHAFPMHILKSVNIPSMIVKTASTEVDGFPNPLLLRDSNLCSDALQSIIGGDRWTFLSRHFADQGKNCIVSSELKIIVEGCLDSLLESHTHNSDAWVNLAAIIGDLPVYEDLRGKTKAVLTKVRIEDFGKAKGLDIGLALHFLSNQALYNRSDISQAEFIHHLVELGRLVFEAGDKADEALYTTLIEALLIASLVPGDPRQSSKLFYASVSNLLRIDASVGSIVRTTLGRSVFDLPASHLHGAWPAVLSARARAN